MRLLLGLLLLAVPAVAGEITVDAGRGPITVHVPDSYQDGTHTPLVLLLHGYGASGAAQEAYMDFLGVHEEYGFLYAFPDGTTDFAGNRFWNATDACCDFGNTNVDDSGYLSDLIDAIEAQVTVDPRRVYLIGHSNGGFMSYRMACDHSDRIAAVASLAGVTWKDPVDCAATAPVHVLQIHGTSDDTILYDGGSIGGNAYPGAVETVEQWAAHAGCDLNPTSGDPINLDKSIPGKETTVLRYEASCAEGGSGELWTIQNGEHVPSLSKPFTTHVIEWLYAHPKPGIHVERYCSPNLANSTGVPGTLDAEGSDAIANDDLTLIASDLPPNEFGYFLASLDRGFVSKPGGSEGNLCLAGDIARFTAHVGNTGANGVLSAQPSLVGFPTNPPQDVSTGQSWNFQTWHRDGNASNFTDAVTILFR